MDDNLILSASFVNRVPFFPSPTTKKIVGLVFFYASMDANCFFNCKFVNTVHTKNNKLAYHGPRIF